MLGKFHSLACHTVQVGRPDLLLAIRTDLSVTQIVGIDVYDVRQPMLCHCRCCADTGDEQEPVPDEILYYCVVHIQIDEFWMKGIFYN